MRAFVAIRNAVAAIQQTDLRHEQLAHKIDILNANMEKILREQNDIYRIHIANKKIIQEIRL